MSDRPKRKSSTSSPAELPVPEALIGSNLSFPTRVFISYRRQDTRAAAAHLYASLAQRFGATRIFRDIVSIEPGDDFPTVIEQAIRSTSVFIALIGRRWLAVKGRDGQRRLDNPKDFVRLEVEAALRYGITIIPVLVDGAKMPARNELPPSIAELATRNAFELPWHEGITRLGRRIAEIERARAQREAAERAERERLDLTRGKAVTPSAWRSQTAIASFNVVIKAMELSLAHQGYKISLEPSDLAKEMIKTTGRPMDQGFIFTDLVYVIDLLGVKAKRSDDRYIARSYPLASLADISAQLALRRPVLTGVKIFEAWFREPAAKTGIIDPTDPGYIQGGTVGAIVAYDPARKEYKLLMPWPEWGDHGIATLSQAAAELFIDQTYIRSIEVVKMLKLFFNKQDKDTEETGEKRPKRKSGRKKNPG